jgi:hypothetical protein
MSPALLPSITAAVATVDQADPTCMLVQQS